MKDYNSETIYNTIKHEILTLSLKPGQSISEHELCKRFAVSRTPVRTALQRLRSDGLIHVVPYRDTTVTLLDFDEIQQTIYLRAAVESAVLRDFLSICTPALEEKIRFQISRQEMLMQGEFEEARFYEMDSKLHAIWFRETGKEKLWRMLQKAQIHYTRFRMLDIVATPDFPRLLKEHKAFLQLIQDRKADDAEELVHRHLYGGIERIQKQTQTNLREYFVQNP